jgi:hypothetical protein
MQNSGAIGLMMVGGGGRVKWGLVSGRSCTIGTVAGLSLRYLCKQIPAHLHALSYKLRCECERR